MAGSRSPLASYNRPRVAGAPLDESRVLNHTWAACPELHTGSMSDMV
jgi:hypothetical protein